MSRSRRSVVFALALWVCAPLGVTPANAAAPLRVQSSGIELAQAQGLYEAARFEEAEALLMQLTAREPRNGIAWSLLGAARHAQKRYEPAIGAFERARALVPPDAALLNNIGISHFLLQRFDQARAAFTAACEVDANDSRAHLFLARIALVRDDAATAEREFAQAMSVPAPDPLAGLYQGVYFLQEKRLDEAQKALEKALELAPDLAAAHLNLGLVYRRKGDRERADVHLKRFRALNDAAISDERLRMRVTELLRSAHADIESGNVDSALRLLLRARGEAPDVAVVHELLGRAYALKGRTPESEHAFARARALSQGAPPK